VRIVGKRKRQRTIYLSPNGRAALEAWLAARPDCEHGNVFCSLGNRSYSGELTTRAIRHLVDGYLAGCGLKAEGISCHSLRHSFATWAIYQGGKIEHVQSAMGHTSRDTTAVYQGVVDKVRHNPALILDGLLGGGSDLREVMP